MNLGHHSGRCVLAIFGELVYATVDVYDCGILGDIKSRGPVLLKGRVWYAQTPGDLMVVNYCYSKLRQLPICMHIVWVIYIKKKQWF